MKHHVRGHGPLGEDTFLPTSIQLAADRAAAEVLAEDRALRAAEADAQRRMLRAD